MLTRRFLSGWFIMSLFLCWWLELTRCRQVPLSCFLPSIFIRSARLACAPFLSVCVEGSWGWVCRGTLPGQSWQRECPLSVRRAFSSACPPGPPSAFIHHTCSRTGDSGIGRMVCRRSQDALFLSSELHQFLLRLYLPSHVWQRRSHTRLIGNAVFQLFSCFLLFWRNLALTSRPRAACLQHLTLRLGSSFLLQQKRHSSSAQGGNPSPLYSFLFSVPSM